MPRKARKNSKSNYYHVIVQGLNRQFIFNKHDYIEKYKKIIKYKLGESNIRILAYCIMSNHAHFLIYSEKCEYISKFMQKIDTSYSIFYNKENERVGYVFKDRYYSQDILDKKHLYNCLKYIHNNPIKAKIVKSMSEYKYSSYNEFLGEKEIISNESLKILFGDLKNFRDQFLLIHSTNCNDENDFLDIKEKDISEFIKEIEKKYNKKITDIKYNKSQLKIIIKEARNQTDVTIEELARIIGLSKSTIANYCKK